ncbi:membrane protein containing Extracellular ligand-binding receptor domain protein [Candidatus Magnetomorum sp. HK-1]|nr:membrane protein containing Extracellular ligand-binding receptor domain protein [Candidatus Magnetomorum sp. HK-1]
MFTLKKLLLFTILLLIILLPVYFLLVKKDNLYIAIVGPMTGSAQLNGKAMVQGATIFQNAFQQNSSLQNYNLQLLVFDDHNDPEIAKDIAKKIAYNTKILFVLGHFDSKTSMIAGEIYKQNKIPVITASAIADNFIKSNEWYFRIIPGASIQAIFAANFIKNELHVDNVELIFIDDQYGLNMEKAFTKACKKLNLSIKRKVLQTENFDENLENMVLDFQSNDQPLVLFIATNDVQGAEIIAALKYPGANFSIVGCNLMAVPSFIEHLKKDSFQENATPGYHSDGIYVVSPFLIEIGNEHSQLFKEQFKSKYGNNPSYVSYAYYDAMKTVLSAVEHTEIYQYDDINQKRKCLRDYISNLKTDEKSIKGITGNIIFNKVGDVIRPYYFGVYQDQKIISAFSQFQTIPQNTDVNLILDQVLEGKLIKVKDRYMRKTQIIYTGIDINEIKDLNMPDRTFNADFYIWFRYKGNFDNAIHIEFENSVDKLSIRKDLNNSSISKVLHKKKGDITIQAFRISGRFKGNFNFRAFPFDTHTLAIHFRHRTLSRDKIIYIPDLSGMDQLDEIKKDLTKRSHALEGWTVTNAIYYQDQFVNESSLGDPEAFKSKNQIIYSRFNTEIHIMRKIVNYLIKNLFLILVLIVISYITYFIPADQFSIRISIGMSTLLTSAFSHIKLTNSLPVSYLLALEYAFFGVYAIATLSIIISVLVYKKYKIIENNNLDEHIIKRTKILLKKLTTLGLIFHPLIVLFSSILIPSVYILNPTDFKNVNTTFFACFIIMTLFCIFFLRLKDTKEAKSKIIKKSMPIINDGL